MSNILSRTVFIVARTVTYTLLASRLTVRIMWHRRNRLCRSDVVPTIMHTFTRISCTSAYTKKLYGGFWHTVRKKSSDLYWLNRGPARYQHGLYCSLQVHWLTLIASGAHCVSSPTSAESFLSTARGAQSSLTPSAVSPRYPLTQ